MPKHYIQPKADRPTQAGEAKNYFTLTQELFKRKRANFLNEKRSLAAAASKAAAAVANATVTSTASVLLRGSPPSKSGGRRDLSS